MQKLLLFIIIVVSLFSCSHTDWRTADNSIAGLAPLPENEPEATEKTG